MQSLLARAGGDVNTATSDVRKHNDYYVCGVMKLEFEGNKGNAMDEMCSAHCHIYMHM